MVTNLNIVFNENCPLNDRLIDELIKETPTFAVVIRWVDCFARTKTHLARKQVVFEHFGFEFDRVVVFERRFLWEGEISKKGQD